MGVNLRPLIESNSLSIEDLKVVGELKTTESVNFSLVDIFFEFMLMFVF